MTRIIREIRTTRQVCATGATIPRIIVTTPRKGSSKKTRTAELTRLAMMPGTRVVHEIIDKTNPDYSGASEQSGEPYFAGFKPRRAPFCEKQGLRVRQPRQGCPGRHW